MIRSAALACAALGALLASAAYAGRSPCREITLRRAKPMMATLVSVTVRGCAEASLELRVREAFTEMERLAAILSEWTPESAVSRVNQRAGIEPVRVPPELWEVLQAAQDASVLTSGAFDATWAALGGLWRFDGLPPRLPPAEDIERQRRLVGYRDLVLSPSDHSAFLRHLGMRLGLGGLAKGYIAEAAANLLVSRGLPDVLVAASGDIAARGRNGNRPWKVGIRDPRRPSGTLATVELRDESISTAGDSERFFILDGRRYHHILDPRTGYPARGTQNVTVVARRAVVADALDTGLFVLGPARGLEVAASIPGVAALFVDDAGEIHLSAGAARRFSLVRSPASVGAAAFPQRAPGAPDEEGRVDVLRPRS
jgi:FAD:protein FMN transferase